MWMPLSHDGLEKVEKEGRRCSKTRQTCLNTLFEALFLLTSSIYQLRRSPSFTMSLFLDFYWIFFHAICGDASGS